LVEFKWVPNFRQGRDYIGLVGWDPFGTCVDLPISQLFGRWASKIGLLKGV